LQNDGRLTFAAPPFMKVDINQHDVYLYRSMGFSKGNGSICTKHSLVFKNRIAKNNIRLFMSGVGA
jgi:hypothetical protein